MDAIVIITEPEFDSLTFSGYGPKLLAINVILIPYIILFKLVHYFTRLKFNKNSIFENKKIKMRMNN